MVDKNQFPQAVLLMSTHTNTHGYVKIRWDTNKTPCLDESTDSDPLASGQSETRKHYCTGGDYQSFCCTLRQAVRTLTSLLTWALLYKSQWGGNQLVISQASPTKVDT